MSRIFKLLSKLKLRIPKYRPYALYKLWLSICLPLITITPLVFVYFRVKSIPSFAAAFLAFPLVIFFNTYIGGITSGISSVLVAAGMYLAFFIGGGGDPSFSNEKLPGAVAFFVQYLLFIGVLSWFFQSSQRAHNAREELKRVRSRLDTIINNSYSYVIIANHKGKILQVNNKFRSILPTNKQNILHHHILETIPFSQPKISRDLLKANLDGIEAGSVVKYDEKIDLQGDEPMEVDLTISATEGGAGEIEYIIISMVDITERKEYERELEKIEQSYSKLVNSNIVGMMIGDPNGKILEANKAFLNTLGYTEKELNQGKINWEEITPVEYRESELRNIIETLQKGYSGPYEKEYFHKAGHRVPVLLSGVLMDREEFTTLYLVIDISERRKLEQKKEEFISIASHELKTPLTSLKGYTQLSNSYLKTGKYPQAEVFLHKIEEQTDKITELINELLDISRIQSAKLNLNITNFDLVELTKSLVQDLQVQYATPAIETDIKDLSLFINADRDRISQVITNLLNNAIKFSPDAEKVKLTLEDRGNEIRLSVQDFGIGIAADMLDKVFDKFVSTDYPQPNHSQGLGLGLYISAEIIAKHGGKIWVKSELGQGSTFQFTLPK